MKQDEVWYVREDNDDGDMPTLWKTKMDAEVYARRLYPDESPDRRYSRIYYVSLLSYDGHYSGDDEGVAQ